MTVSLPVREISLRERRDQGFSLKHQAVKNRSQGAVGLSALVRAVVEPAVAQDDMRTNHALGQVVVVRKPREIQKRQHLFLVFQEAARKSLPMLVGMRRGGKEEQSLFEPAHLAHKV